MKAKYILFQNIFLITVLLIPSLLHAQPGGVPGSPDADVPIDGGLSLLVAAGIGYGAKKIREKRKKQQEEEQGK